MFLDTRIIHSYSLWISYKNISHELGLKNTELYDGKYIYVYEIQGEWTRAEIRTVKRNQATWQRQETRAENRSLKSPAVLSKGQRSTAGWSRQTVAGRPT